MRARRGQVALLLVVVLVAATVLTLMNVNVFLAVRAKNRTMNAGDAAALAVARIQGRLLNEIAALNVEHLRAALELDFARCDAIVAAQKRLSFLGPLQGIRAGNDAAYRNGVTDEASGGMREILLEHVNDIREVFVHNLAFYPEPWVGAWEEYAEALELQLRDPLYAGPDNVDFVDMHEYFPLFSKAFYNAVAGRMWCWFRNRQDLFNYDTEGLAAHYGGPGSGDPVPRDDCNSEVYSLNVTFRPLSELGDANAVVAVVASLTDADPEIVREVLVPLLLQTFAFYDGHWARWSTYGDIQFGSGTFPIEGEIKAQYDVLGCSATCRVQMDADDLLDERSFAQSDWEHLERGVSSAAETKIINWNASAKPFGWLYALDEDVVAAGTTGGADGFLDHTTECAVTAWGRLIVPRAGGTSAVSATVGDVPGDADAVVDASSEDAEETLANSFEDVRLVPVDSVNNGVSCSMADRDWVRHVKYHLSTSPHYAGRHKLPQGRYVRRTVACWYCDQLDLWDHAWFRYRGRKWLERPENVKSCERCTGPGPSATGGAIHAH